MVRLKMNQKKQQSVNIRLFEISLQKNHSWFTPWADNNPPFDFISNDMLDFISNDMLRPQYCYLHYVNMRGLNKSIELEKIYSIIRIGQKIKPK